MAERRQDHSLRATIALTVSFLGPRRWRLAVLSVLAALGGFAEATVLVVIARLAFVLASESKSVAVRLGPVGNTDLDFWTLVGVAAALVLFRGLLQVIVAHLSSRLWSDVLAETRLGLLGGFLRSSWALQSNERTGRLQELVSTVAAQAGASVSLLSQSLVSLFSLLAFAATAFFVNAVAAVVVLVAGTGMALLLRPIRSRVRRQARRVTDANIGMATGISEVADGTLAVRVFDAEEAVYAQADRRVTGAADAERRLRNTQQLGPALYQSAAMLLIVACVAGIAAADITRLGTIGGVVLVMIRSLSYAQQLQNSYQAFHASAPYLELIHDELDRFTAQAVDRGGAPFEHVGVIDFDAVSFQYVAGTDTLRRLSFTVPHGEIVGIIGPSGAGKSTLVQLLLRLREPTTGTIRADGCDIARLSIGDWYRRVAFVPQDAWLFSGTVAENIEFFRSGVTRETVVRAARRANLHDEIMAMADGYDTPVGERGGRLSGGQRQRLCIARALVGEPDVLVLDEPTSALDVHSETLIRETIAALAPRTTVFVVAHRLSTLEVCDRIMVLRDGRLEGFDTPDVLASTNRFYREALELSGLR